MTDRLSPPETTAPSPGGAGPAGGRRTIVAVLVLAVLAGLLLAFLPRPPRLGPVTTGDEELAARVRAALDDDRGHVGLGVAEATPTEVTVAGLGTTGEQDPVRPDTLFEVGSVTKAMSGMLLAALAADDRVDPQATIAEVAGDTSFASDTVAGATLAQLASHRAGLPRLPAGPEALLWSAAGNLLGIDPYQWGEATPEGLIEETAATTAARDVGEFGYSNLGGALLGHLLARETGTDYPRLLRQRLLAPLAMDDTSVVAGEGTLPEGRALGHRPNGRRVDAWTNGGYAPAGAGVWSTAEDAARLVQGVLDGSAPGASAARPSFTRGEDGRVGYGWLTDEHDGRTLTWHDGGTGGFRSYIALDREAERGVVVLSNTARDVDVLGRRLLGLEEAPSDPWWQDRVAWVALGLLLLGGFMAARVIREVSRTGTVAGDRVDLVNTIAEPIALLVIAGVVGPWHRIPVAVWLLGATVVGGAALAATRAWGRVVPIRSRSALGWVGVGLNALVSVAILGGSLLLTLLR